jgi:heme/copper-type cytochrome/quinol oxidase subunit 2
MNKLQTIGILNFLQTLILFVFLTLYPTTQLAWLWWFAWASFILGVLAFTTLVILMFTIIMVQAQRQQGKHGGDYE